MSKSKTLFPDIKEKKEFSLSTAIHGKKIKVDFDAPMHKASYMRV